jgi:hypothetical protein
MPKPAPPLSEFSLNMLRDLFSKTTQQFFEQLCDLNALQRKSLSKDLDSAIRSLNRACSPSIWIGVDVYFRAIDEFASRMATSDLLEPAIETLEKQLKLIRQENGVDEIFGVDPPPTSVINGRATESDSFLFKPSFLVTLYRRLQAFQIAIGNQKAVGAALKAQPHKQWGSRSFRLPDQKFKWSAWLSGRMLLNRPEDWKKSLFLDWCENIEKQYGLFYAHGFILVIEAALKENPDWQADLEPYFGKAMVLDGFGFEDWHLHFDGNMVLTGLNTEVTGSSPVRRGQQFIRSFANAGKDVLNYVLLMPQATRPAREELLPFALDSLSAGTNDDVAKLWADFLVKLSPTREEVAEHASAFLNLTGATTLTAINLGLEFCEKSWEAKTLAPDELINALVIPLTQRNQTIGLRAWKLAATIAASTPEHFDKVVQVSFDCLTSPHRKLRETTAKWLAKHAKSFSGQARDMLKTLFPLLGPAEQSALGSIVQIEDSVTQMSGQVDDFAHRVATFTDHIENLPARQRARLHVVQQWLETGVVSKLEPMPPTFEASLVRDVIPFQSPEEIATAFIEALGRPLTQIDLELLLDGIRRFPQGGREVSIRKTMDPLHQLYAGFYEKGKHPKHILSVDRPELYPSAAEASELAELWLREGGQEILYSFKKSLRWRLCVRQVAFFMKNGEIAPVVSLPTNRCGWIHPENFTDRILESRSLDSIDPDDLALALYRLAPDLEARTAAWLKLENKLDESPQSDAIRIAIALESETQVASTRFEQRLATQPIKDTLLRSIYCSEDTIMEVIGGFAQVGSRLFRLRIAAERSRYGLGKSSQILPEFSYDKMFFWNSALPEASQTDTTSRTLEPSDQLKWETLFPVLFNPVEIDTSPLLELELGERLSFIHTISEYPILHPYLASASGDAWRYSSEAEDWLNIHCQICDWPLGAQRFLEAGKVLCATPFTENYCQGRSRVMAIPFSRAGEWEHVDIQPHISSIVLGGLKSIFREDNEPFVNLLVCWLHDGRATPDDIMNALANGVLSEEVKFANFERIIVSLMATSPAGSLTVIGTIEQALAGEFQKTTPRKQSQLLERLELLLAETGRVVESSAAREKLATLAAGKSAAGEKARRLISGTNPPNQPPLAVAIASALLDC